MRGVKSTAVGYSGGTSEHPTYKTVCAGDGHTEVVAVEFDPTVIPYERLLEIFWREHDPTRPAKAQYRSVVFATTPAQLAAATASKARHAASRRIVTAIEPLRKFWLAEEYHQRYVEKRKARYGV